MTQIQYAWRRSADSHPIVYLDVILVSDEGWRMASFPAYEVLAHAAQELNR